MSIQKLNCNDELAVCDGSFPTGCGCCVRPSFSVAIRYVVSPRKNGEQLPKGVRHDLSRTKRCHD